MAEIYAYAIEELMGSHDGEQFWTPMDRLVGYPECLPGVVHRQPYGANSLDDAIIVAQSLLYKHSDSHVLRILDSNGVVRAMIANEGVFYGRHHPVAG